MSAWFCWTASEGRGCRGLGCAVAAVAACLDSGSCLVSSTTLGTHGLGLVGSIPEHSLETRVFDYKLFSNPKQILRPKTYYIIRYLSQSTCYSAVLTSIVGCTRRVCWCCVVMTRCQTTYRAAAGGQGRPPTRAAAHARSPQLPPARRLQHTKQH